MRTADDYPFDVANGKPQVAFVIYVYIYWEKVREILLFLSCAPNASLPRRRS